MKPVQARKISCQPGWLARAVGTVEEEEGEADGEADGEAVVVVEVEVTVLVAVAAVAVAGRRTVEEEAAVVVAEAVAEAVAAAEVAAVVGKRVKGLRAASSMELLGNTPQPRDAPSQLVQKKGDNINIFFSNCMQTNPS